MKTLRINGKIVLFSILIAYFAVFFILLRFFNRNLMELTGVPVWSSAFSDLRVITAGSDSIESGYDPLIKNPADPWKRRMNYPAIWQGFRILQLRQKDNFLIGIGVVIFFYLSIFKILPKINLKEALIYGLLILSPGFMFAVERANNDLILFIFLAISLAYFQKKKVLFYSALFFCFLLKLYPIGAFFVILEEKKRDFLKIASIIFLLLSAYALTFYKELMLVSHSTPRPVYNSYGGLVALNFFSVAFGNIIRKNIPLEYLIIASAVLIFSVCVLVYRIARSKKIRINDCEYLAAFRVGAGIYIVTFIIGNNWIYRLIFLLFTIPQILYWIKHEQNIKILSLTSLLFILWSCFFPLFYKYMPHWKTGIALTQGMHWFLFSFFLFMLLNSAADWLKIDLGLKQESNISLR